MKLLDIPGQLGYLVSRNGDVWSTKSGKPKKLIAFKRSRDGRLGVNLTHGGVCKLHYVHHLVMLAFVGPKVIEIRKQLALGRPKQELAKQFGTARRNTQDIHVRHTWKHV